MSQSANTTADSTSAWEYLIGVDSCILCPECSQPMKLRESNKFGSMRKFYSCSRWPDCSGSHGAHPDGRPLGIPATEETKKARVQAHAKLDEYRKLTGYSKNRAYKEICKLMGLTRKEGHIGRFTISDCMRLIDLLGSAMASWRR